MSENECKWRQKWNPDEDWCECKGSDYLGSHSKNYMSNPNTCECECNKPCKTDKYLYSKTCSCKSKIGKLALECEYVMLSITEISLDDKKETCKKNNCLIHMMLLVIIWLLLLAVVSIGCYFCYMKRFD